MQTRKRKGYEMLVHNSKQFQKRLLVVATMFTFS